MLFEDDDKIVQNPIEDLRDNFYESIVNFSRLNLDMYSITKTQQNVPDIYIQYAVGFTQQFILFTSIANASSNFNSY